MIFFRSFFVFPPMFPHNPLIAGSIGVYVCQVNLPTQPGDNVEMTIELIHPIAMSQGLTFAIREGGRTVGSGRVATIIE